MWSGLGEVEKSKDKIWDSTYLILIEIRKYWTLRDSSHILIAFR